MAAAIEAARPDARLTLNPESEDLGLFRVTANATVLWEEHNDFPDEQKLINILCPG